LALRKKKFDGLPVKASPLTVLVQPFAFNLDRRRPLPQVRWLVLLQLDTLFQFRRVGNTHHRAMVL
jgi:hypothetical protein